MGEKSAIEWTDDTFNPWIGCSKVHTGCLHCYAERDFDKRKHFAKWGPNGTRVVTSESNWAKPLKWNREAEAAGVRSRVFCASLADVFEDWRGNIYNTDSQRLMIERDGDWIQPETPQGGFSGMRPLTLDDLRKRLFALIDATPWLDWQLVTKRPENVRKMWPCGLAEFPNEHVTTKKRFTVQVNEPHRRNVWLLTSVSDQATADEMVPPLLECRDLVPVLGLSIEPLLGPIVLRPEWLRMLQWVIVGGESGPRARPMHPDWVRSIRDQCLAAGVPFFFKQWGDWSPNWAWAEAHNVDPVSGLHEYPGQHMGPRGLPIQGPNTMFRVGKKAAGRMLDGVTWDQFPEMAVAL